MKKLIFAVKAWWEKISEEAHRQKVLKHERNIKREALSRLQVREFEGEIYLFLTMYQSFRRWTWLKVWAMQSRPPVNITRSTAL